MDAWLTRGIYAILATAALLLLASGTALAAKPARTVTMAVGHYVVDVNLDQDPPFADHPLEVTVVPHDSTLHLSGRIIAKPGLGTDATNLFGKLNPQPGSTSILTGTINLPVRGAWLLGVELNGPQGNGAATFAVTVAAPGAIPTWLGWLIALTPSIGIAWWLWWQHRYRRTLTRQEGLQA